MSRMNYDFEYYGTSDLIILSIVVSYCFYVILDLQRMLKKCRLYFMTDPCQR